MKRTLLVVLLGSMVMGCSTAYRSGQTPDDVYYSPTPSNSGYVNVDDYDQREGYDASRTPLNERYLRMKTFGGSRWRAFDDDFAYWNNPYWNNSLYFDGFNRGWGWGTGIGFGSPFIGGMFGPSYIGSSLFYSPFSPYFYGAPVVVINNPKFITPRSTGPRTYNLGNYNPPSQQNFNSKYGSGVYRSGGGQYYNNNSGSPRGGYNPRSSNSGYNGSPMRTFSNSNSGGSSNYSNSSSGSSSGSSGSAPVRSFGRGGN
ncbi:MAG: hypothetical protein FJX83_00260 [Bacteroidetes bacterium]|nr:hypothetical protein [Bacteroidota bacterium]